MVLMLSSVLLALAIFSLSNATPAKPVWPSQYVATASIRLPYIQLEEPVVIWFDGVNNRSRVDYYNGMDVSILRGDQGSFGESYLLSPFTDETVTNQRTCFQTHGSIDSPSVSQSIFPDVTDFEYAGQKSWKGIMADVWAHRKEEGGKVNIYTLITTDTPLLYKMEGYDTLLGSHYDNYEIEYYDIQKENVNSSVFDEPMKGLTCRDFPGPGHQHHSLANPLTEFVHPTRDDHVQSMFHGYIKEHGKRYEHAVETTAKMNNFRHNLRYIRSMNRKNLGFRLAVNHLADMSWADLKGFSSSFRTTKNVRPHGGLLHKHMEGKDIPSTVDWRSLGAVARVKDQAICGSCWSFATAAVIESANFIKHGKLVLLSEQNLVDCSWGFGNNGCNGGEDFRAYEWIIKHGGIATDETYGNYLGVNGYCHVNNSLVTIGAKLSNYVKLPSGDIHALKQAVATVGPISVAIDAAHASFSFYAGGVFYEPTCGNKEENLDHAVLLVGYGTLGGQDYWIIKNSWSNYWGVDGYALMSMKDNNCGVATDATYPIVV